jgi:TIR domain-containing protein
MARPRVFISHSTSGDPAAYARSQTADPKARAALEARERLAKSICDNTAARLTARGRYAVLLDRRGIKPGDPWYSKINVWVSGCDAAVVLLSDRALKSRYVQYEVSVLASRYHKSNKAFPILPVHLPPVDEKAIDASPIEASRITGVQAITVAPGASVTSVVDAIAKRLGAIVHGKTPLDRQIGIVADILRSVPPNVIDQELCALDMDLGDWDFAEDGPRKRLAAKLMGAGLDAGIGVLERLDAWLQKQGADDLLEIINRVGSAWVPHRAVSDLTDASQARRSVAATLSNRLSAGMYLWQAHPTFKTCPGPPIAQVAGITGERRSADVLATLEAQISRELVGVAALRARTEREALETLAIRAKKGASPIFVLLPQDGLDAKTLEQLQAKKEFAGLVFFVLCGGKQPTRKFLDRGNVIFLEPPLESGDEDRYCLSYDEGRRALGRSDDEAQAREDDR